MRISVDEGRCSGHGRCYALAPDVFKPDEEGFNVAIGHTIEVAAGRSEIARAAVLNCPERALTIVEE